MSASHSPVNAFKQHRQLRRGKSDFAFLRRWPDKPPLLQALGKQTCPLAIPPDDLYQVAATPPEHKHVAIERILLQCPLGLSRQSGKSAPHVRDPGGQPDFRVRRNWDHADSPLIKRERASGSKAPFTRSRCPPERSISIEQPVTARPSDGGRLSTGAWSTISTGKKQGSAFAMVSGSGAKRGSRSHLKIRFAFIAYRRATCATDMSGAVAWKQIDRFSSSAQSRFVRRAIPCDLPHSIHYPGWILSHTLYVRQGS